MEIKARFDHFNFNVLDLDRSIRFYEQALGLKEINRKTAADSSFIWLRDRTEPYDLGESEYHLCMRVAGDYDKVREYHREMGCICYENTDMGLYFIIDPDGYWIEIVPLKR